MNKKNVIGLFLLGFLVMTGLFTGVHYMTNMEANIEIEQIQKDITKDDNSSNNAKNSEALVSDSQLTLSSNQSNEQKDTVKTNELPGLDSVKTDDTIADETIEKVQGEKLTEASDNQETPDSNGISNIEEPVEAPQISETPKPDTILADNTDNVLTSSNIKDLSIEDTLGNSVLTAPELELIYDCNEVDYEAYIPKTVFDSKIETMLDIDNPELNIEAEAAILFDAKTKEVLFYKNPIEAVFPASTAKLLTSLVTLDWCNETEEVTIGEEINMIASDSSQASIKVGQVLTIRNILEGMLLPSGNDAAYAAAAYVGKKSLQNIDATDEDGILEFTRLMNIKAKSLGVKNSVFKTPDGYDALGQYTTAYDMGLIGLAARENQVILEISQKSRSRNVFPRVV